MDTAAVSGCDGQLPFYTLLRSGQLLQLVCWWHQLSHSVVNMPEIAGKVNLPLL